MLVFGCCVRDSGLVFLLSPVLSPISSASCSGMLRPPHQRLSLVFVLLSPFLSSSCLPAGVGCCVRLAGLVFFLSPNSCVSPSLPSCLPRCLPPGLESGWMVRPSRSCLPAFSPACFPAGLGCCVSCLLVCPPSCLPDGLGYRDRLAGLVFHQLFAVLGGVVLRFLKFDMNCTIVATCD